ncbi:glycosyltransferase family 39 protein [Derxia gummosa]|uniref:Glycosyltransferase family 39 protein n=1 Tax=Derxia gummosa DSM 723 TaxID=1121388 RepID=A0A8B6XB63_9BURK|nr:glycosyltransferase family 39 protein [Derxia gummosa]
MFTNLLRSFMTSLGLAQTDGRGIAALPRPWRANAWQSIGWTRAASWTLFWTLGLYVLFCYGDVALSNDEPVQHTYGQLLLDFYRSGFEDQFVFGYKNLYLYGGLFDLVAAWLASALDVRGATVWELRHLLSGLFGLFGMVGVWRLGRHVASEKVGVVAALLLALTGAWTGALFTHTKDVPFAAFMTWALYYTVRIAPLLPRVPLGLSVKLGLAIGAAFGMRVGAAFAVMYVLLTVALALVLVATGDLKARAQFALRSVVTLLPAAVACLALTGLCWPWAVMDLDHLAEAARTFSHFSFGMYTVLDGQPLALDQVPGRYLPTYFLVRMPEVVLAGLAALLWWGAAAIRHWRPAAADDRLRALVLFPVVFALAFPLAFAWLKAPPLYNGLRHFLFIVPVAAVLAALGWHLAWRAMLRRPVAPWALVATLCGLCLSQSVLLARLHPYEYVAYNTVFGEGTARAVTQYEGDYWSTSLRELSGQLNEFVRREGKTVREPYQVAVCAEGAQAAAYLSPQFRVTRDWRRADFFLAITQLDCAGALKGDVIGKVDRLGATLSVLKDRRTLPSWLRNPR